MTPNQKIVQYLNEAHATETALTRVLQSQIAMTPRGSYRSALETHLAETHDHADRVGGGCRSSARAAIRCRPSSARAETVDRAGARARARRRSTSCAAPAARRRCSRTPRTRAATEALEIATYTAIERLAKDVGDDKTAKLAASIRADEEKMLARVLREIPKLTDAVVAPMSTANVVRRSATTGAGEASRRRPRRPSAPRARPARCRASPRPRARSRAPSPPRTTSRSTATAQLTADEIVAPAAGALAGRPGQGRRLRAPPREPHDGAGPRLRAARRRAVARLRRADRRARSRPRWPRPPTSASRPCAPTSARTRTARRVLNAAERQLTHA